MAKRPIKAWIALDTYKAVNRAYAITGIPQTIASFLENELEKPVVDETGLANSYGCDISLQGEQKSPGKPNPEVLKKAVQEQLGLELVSDRRPIEMLIVEQAGKAERKKQR